MATFSARATTAASSAALALALAALALGSLRAAIVALPNLQLDQPIAPPWDATGGELTPPGRVLFVLIDGLRADVAAELPFLGVLASRGARVDLWAELPSYSSAEYVSMLTGVPPRDSGVRTNTRLARTPLDNVPRRLRADGRRAVQVGDQVDWWERIFGTDFATTAVVPPDALIAETARRTGNADLVVVHICGVDEQGHSVGAAAPTYRQAALDADAQTRSLAQAWGWPDATVIVLSDHGHAPAGGHGGDESEVRRAWLVAAGPGIASGARVSGARMIDVAPTLAALLGIPAPGTAQGRTLIEALTLSPHARATLTAADRHRIVPAVSAADARRKALLATDENRLAARFAGLIAVLALGAWGLRRTRAARRGLLAGGSALALTVAAFAIRYGRPSFSADQTTERLGYGVGILAVGASMLAFAPAFVAVLRGHLKSADARAFAVAAVFGAAPIVAIVFVMVGAFHPRIDCEPAWWAALPLCAYAAFGPPVLAASILTATAHVRDLLGIRPP